MRGRGAPGLGGCRLHLPPSALRQSQPERKPYDFSSAVSATFLPSLATSNLIQDCQFGQIDPITVEKRPRMTEN